MDLPTPPTLKAIESLSPSFYNAALICPARAAWQQFGKRELVPSATGGILGSCFHAVMEAANSGHISAGSAGIEQAKAIFDNKAKTLLAAAHPLIRAKFPVSEKIPFYFQRQGRAVQLASQTAASQPPPPESLKPTKAFQAISLDESMHLIEETLASKDEEIKGRIDLWDRSTAKVIDYKSGQEPKDGEEAISPSEIRQLRLYVYLALQNGLPANKAAIVRGSSQTVEIDVSLKEAEDEAVLGKQLRLQFNDEVSKGATFFSIAKPSASACAGCPCIPFCSPFWDVANKDWETSCGTHVEGRIASKQDANFGGTTLRTISLVGCRGTSPFTETAIEQIPLPWLSIGATVPDVGNTVRIVSGARLKSDRPVQVIHVDRFRSTAIWKV